MEARITERTKAVVVVHLSGNTADMDAVMALAQTHKLAVIEDCAQAPGVTYKGKHVGSIGHVGVFSLTETKNINLRRRRRSDYRPAEDRLQGPFDSQPR